MLLDPDFPNQPVHIPLISDSTSRTSKRTSSSSAPIWTSSCQALDSSSGAAVSSGLSGPPAPSSILGGVAFSASPFSVRSLPASSAPCFGIKYPSPFLSFGRFRRRFAKVQDVSGRRKSHSDYGMLQDVNGPVPKIAAHYVEQFTGTTSMTSCAMRVIFLCTVLESSVQNIAPHRRDGPH